MFKKIFLTLAAVSASAAFSGEDVFKLTPADKHRISKEFIANIRAGVGDKNASHASTALYKFVLNKISNTDRDESEDYMIGYLNYQERLYKRAFAKALAQAPVASQAQMLKDENAWKQQLLKAPVYKVKNSDTGEPDTFSVQDRVRDMRLFHNRTQYWEASPERRAVLDRFNGLQITCVYGPVTVKWNEVRRITPFLEFQGTPIDPKTQTYIEDIATLPLEFCRETKVNNDVYQIAILIPTNDVCSERSTQGYERVIVIWKNRTYHALYYLPHHAEIKELTLKGPRLSVKFVQIDEFFNRDKRKQNPTQTFTVDCTYKIFAPLKITNWLDYYTDGLGNHHKHDCCKGKF